MISLDRRTALLLIGAAIADSPARAQPAGKFVAGRNFLFYLPEGWEVGEEGNHVLALRAGDHTGGIAVAGITGYPYMVDPVQFALAVMTQVFRIPPDIQVIGAWQVPALPGQTYAVAAELLYVLQEPSGTRRMQGTAIVNMALTYGMSSGLMHLAASTAEIWGRYVSWLPQVALLARNVGPNAFGRGDVSNTNRAITARQSADYQNYLQWSRATWNAVEQQRAASDAWRQRSLDPVLTGQQYNPHPWGEAPTRDSITPAVIWISRDGRRIESADPSFDPRTAADPDWRRVQR